MSGKESLEARLCSFSRVMMPIARFAVFNMGSYQGEYCLVGLPSRYLKLEKLENFSYVTCREKADIDTCNKFLSISCVFVVLSYTVSIRSIIRA